MKNASERIVRRKLSDEILERLQTLITSAGLSAGDEMPSERELMERFGVGRPAIREAMQALSNMGLVSISQGERAKVRELTADSILSQIDQSAKILLSNSAESLEHLKSARIFFELGIVRQATEQATKADVERLNTIVELQKNSLGDGEAFIDADMLFHTAIAEISGNPIYVAVSKSMLGWLKEYHTEVLIWSGKEEFTLVEHEEIIKFIGAKNVELAENAMTKHLKRSNALYAKVDTK